MLRRASQLNMSAAGHGSEPLMESDKPPSGILGVLLVLLVIVLVVVALVVAQVLQKVNDSNAAYLAENYTNPVLNELQALDHARLTEYKKNESGTFLIPIDRAKELLLQRGSVRPLRE